MRHFTKVGKKEFGIYKKFLKKFNWKESIKIDKLFVYSSYFYKNKKKTEN